MMMLRKVGWCVMVAAMILVATPGSEAKSKRRNARPFALRAHVVDFDSALHGHRRARRKTFEGYQTHTIEFDVFRRGRSELERPTKVKLYLPNGDLYQAIDVDPFTDEAAPGKRRRRRPPTATARVQVSNSVITRFGLYGEWRADVCWELGSETSCRRAMSFEIY